MTARLRSAFSLAAAIALATALGAPTAGPASAIPAPLASTTSMPAVATSTRVTLTIKDGTKKTLILVSRTGQTLATRAITTSSQEVTLSVPSTKARNLTGATMHLVHSATAPAASRGDYFGPVVLGWKGTKRTSATRVYTKLSATSAATIALGTVQVSTPSARQGYAYATDSQPEADSTLASQVRATGGKPCGVGSYGLSSECGRVAGAATRTGRADPPSGPAPDATLGGDFDDDGIPNAFDVNDDGDAKVDSADASTPSPAVVVESATSAACPSVELRIFTNFKATQPRFAGTLNYYGTGAFQATKAKSAEAIEKTMTMVFSRLTQVCGKNVTKTELKGIGVPYAPADYVELTSACSTGDYQWYIGQGRMCSPAGSPGGSGYAFGAAYDFTATSLPSGQDAFMMRLTVEGGAQYEVTSSAGFIFVTHPMVVAYGLSAGSLVSIDYGTTQDGPDGTALVSEPPIAIGENDALYLRIYRPQRLRIDGEAGESDFVDLGGFRYSFDVPNLPGVRCEPPTADASMATDTPVVGVGSAPTLLLTLDLGECITSSGQSWTTGQGDVDIMVQPQGPGGNSAQKFRLTRS